MRSIVLTASSVFVCHAMKTIEPNFDYGSFCSLKNIIMFSELIYCEQRFKT